MSDKKHRSSIVTWALIQTMTMLLCAMLLLVHPVTAAPASANTFEMPSDAVYGWLCTVDWPASIVSRKLKYLQQITLRGHVTIAPEERYALKGSGVLCMKPEVLSKIPVDPIYGIAFDSTELDDNGAKHLKRFVQCISLSLEETDIGDTAVEIASVMPDLKRLVLARTEITGKNFALLAKLKRLEYLDISNNMLVPGALRHLSANTAIRQIDLRRLRLKDNDLANLNHMASMSRLRLSENTELTDNCLPLLVSLKALKDVDICETKITAAGIIKAKIPKLHNLLITKGQFTSAQKQNVIKAYPGLVLTEHDPSTKADPTVFSPLH